MWEKIRPLFLRLPLATLEIIKKKSKGIRPFPILRYIPFILESMRALPEEKQQGKYNTGDYQYRMKHSHPLGDNVYMYLENFI